MNKKQSRVMRSFQIKVITQLGQGTFESVTIKNPIFSRWLVGYLADNQIPFQVVHLGEGVTKIIKSGTVCPHCQGRGFIEMDNTPLDLSTESYYNEVTDVEEEKSCCGDDCTCSGGCKDGGECCKHKNKAA